MRFFFRCLFLLFAVSVWQPRIFAANTEAMQLKHLNKKITTLKSSIDNVRQHRQNTQQLLAAAETKLGKMDTRLAKINRQLRQSQSSIQNYADKIAANQRQLQSEQTALADQLRRLYYLGQQPALKALLNPEDSRTTRRLLVYYKSLNVALNDKINALEQTQLSIRNNQLAKQGEVARLKRLHTALSSGRKKQDKVQRQRQHLLAQLDITITNKREQLQQLVLNKNALEKTLQKLGKESVQTQQRFKALAGKMQWPVSGRLSQQYNVAISGSELRTNGVVIAAATNSPVRAVAPGRVVFARWLAGYGLLIIINHGSGYMTLYGRNHSLLKSVGDSVKAGEIIASSGQTGGFRVPGLYFAIRHDGTPLDPSRWCS